MRRSWASLFQARKPPGPPELVAWPNIANIAPLSHLERQASGMCSDSLVLDLSLGRLYTSVSWGSGEDLLLFFWLNSMARVPFALLGTSPRSDSRRLKSKQQPLVGRILPSCLGWQVPYCSLDCPMPRCAESVPTTLKGKCSQLFRSLV